MDAFLKMFSSAWPGMLLVAGVIGTVIAWFATRGMRKKMTEAQEEVSAIYKQTIAAQEILAQTLAASHAKQIALLTEERKESDARHEGVIAEYRTNLHAVRGELQDCSYRAGEYKAEVAKLKAQTDFQPVMSFLQEASAQNTKVQTQILDYIAVCTPLLSVIAPVLERVMESLKIPPAGGATNVIVVNDKEHSIPVDPVK